MHGMAPWGSAAPRASLLASAIAAPQGICRPWFCAASSCHSRLKRLAVDANAVHGDEHRTVVADEWFRPGTECMQRRDKRDKAAQYVAADKLRRCPYKQVYRCAGEAGMKRYRLYVRTPGLKQNQVGHVATAHATRPDWCAKMVALQVEPAVRQLWSACDKTAKRFAAVIKYDYCLLRGEAQLACQSDGLDCVAPAGDHTDGLVGGKRGADPGSEKPVTA